MPETRFFSFLMHLCDMQVNRISMESAKCAQSNKTYMVTFYCFCNALSFISNHWP